MVDTKEIEELRALAFASIPTAARKPTGSDRPKRKRKVLLVDTEEGEIISDEDAVTVAASSTSTYSQVPALQLDQTSYSVVQGGVSQKQRRMASVSMEVAAPGHTETPSLVSIVPFHPQTLGLERNRISSSITTFETGPSQDENGATVPTKMGKNEEAKSAPHYSRGVNATRQLRSACASLPTRIPLPAGGIRKEADAFLASLNIPVTASPTITTGFNGDRSSSLVIKFSDDDSDSEDGQGEKDRLKVKNLTDIEPTMPSTSGINRLGLPSQSTSGLKSEIDRVKRKIAAIERAKGAAAASKVMKSIVSEVPKQFNAKPELLATSVNSKLLPVDLESLRQKIAAKEHELKQRKQRVFKENGNALASSPSMDPSKFVQTSDSKIPSPGKSQGEPGSVEALTEETFITPGLPVNEVSTCPDGTNEGLALNSHEEETTPVCDQGQGTLRVTAMRGLDSDSHDFLMSMDSPEALQSVAAGVSKPWLESMEYTLTVVDRRKSTRDESNSPKRKRQESDRANELSTRARGGKGVKRPRSDESVRNSSLVLPTLEESQKREGIAVTASPSETNVDINKSLDDQGSPHDLFSREQNLNLGQGTRPATPSRAELQQFVDIQARNTSLMLNASDTTGILIPTGRQAAGSEISKLVTSMSEDGAGLIVAQMNDSLTEPSDQKMTMSKVAELPLFQGDGVRAVNVSEKDRSVSADMVPSPLSSPSRAIVRTPESSNIFSHEGKKFEGILVGGSSNCSTLPVWVYNNQFLTSNMAIVEEDSEQRLQYGYETLCQLQEEEDTVDKELEEAQQDRRRCEVREHITRRQYRDAQEALRSSNMRCEMLFHKREMLSARIKAAQLQSHLSKPSYLTNHGEGALVSLGSAGYAERSPFRLETTLCASQDGATGNASHGCKLTEDYEGFLPASTAVSDLSRRTSHKLNVVSEPFKPTISTGTSNGPDGFNSTVSKMLDDSATTGSATENESNTSKASLSSLPKDGSTTPICINKPSSQALSTEEFSTCPIVEDLVQSSPDLLPHSVYDLEVKEATGGEERPEAAHNNSFENESHHGFSSASFATDLERDENSRHGITNVNKKAQAEALGEQLHNSSYFGPPCSRKDRDSNRGLDESAEDNGTSIMDSLTFQNNDIYVEQQQRGHLSTSLHVGTGPIQQEQPPQLHEEERMERCTLQTVTSFSKADELDGVIAGCTKSDLKVYDTSLDVLPLGEEAGMQRPVKLVGPTDDLCRVWDDARADRELDTGSETEYFVPSMSLRLLFGQPIEIKNLDENLGTVQRESALEMSDQVGQVVSQMYESPLGGFCCYGGIRHSGFSGKRKVAIDPHRVLCKYELHGKCNNSECVWQHKRDYIVGSSEFLQATEGEERNRFDTALSKPSGRSMASSFKAYPYNMVTGVPVYRIGSHLVKRKSSGSPLSGITHKKQIGLECTFLVLHRQVLMDVPSLLDSSLELPTLINTPGMARQHFYDRLWIEDEVTGHKSGALKDADSLLETALELFDFDIKVQKSEVRRSVLYVLSRALEVNPCSVATWVVYLHLFCQWEKSLNNDDIFLTAVQHNSGSYELWMMFIKSRKCLTERLEGYESAIVALGSKCELQGHPFEDKSCLLLDLALQKLNFMCTSNLGEKAANWVEKMTSLATENLQGSGGKDDTSASVLLSCLAEPDLCVLWVCCAYVVLELQLPTVAVEAIGCKQRPCFHNIWVNAKVTSSFGRHRAMKVLHVAASRGKGCLRLDLVEPAMDKELQLAKTVLASNYVQCAAVCEGVNSSRTLADKYFDLLLPSVEFTLLRVQLEEHMKGKASCVDIFEKALTHWPSNKSGRVRLWNQYIGFVSQAKGVDFVKPLLARCAEEICGSDSCGSITENLGSFLPPVFDNKVTLEEKRQDLMEGSNDGVRNAFQLLPSIVKQQLAKGSAISGQMFAYEDVAFGYLNLAFGEVLDGNIESAKNALQTGLSFAGDAESMGHCLKELAAFISRGMNGAICELVPSHDNGLFTLFDRCVVESQLLDVVHPLSRNFCDSIKKRRVRLFVESLLGPWPATHTFLNPILETIYGPTLLPNKLMDAKDFFDYSEKLLEILPSNVRLAASICRAVQNRALNTWSGSAALFWCASLLIDSLYQASPDAPEPWWVEAGDFLKLLEVDSLLEDFYWLALTVHPCSSALWHGLLAVSCKTGNSRSTMDAAREKGVRLNAHSIST